MTTVTIDSVIYKQGPEHSVELEVPDISSTDKVTLVTALQNAGKVGVIDKQLAQIKKQEFEKLWQHRTDNLEMITMPEAVKEHILKLCPHKMPEKDPEETVPTKKGEVKEEV